MARRAGRARGRADPCSGHPRPKPLHMPHMKDALSKDGPSRDAPSRDTRGGAAREAKSAASPNIQDVFLNYARREKLLVAIRLLDGQTLEGRIKNFDRFAVIVDHAGA